MLTVPPWVTAGLVAFAVVVTLGANWLASRMSDKAQGSTTSLGAVLASLIWVVLLTVAGIIALRYIERMESAFIGYLAFVLLAFLLSLVRATLHQRIETQPKPLRFDELLKTLRTNWLHNLTYLFAASISYISIAFLLQQPVEPQLFVPLAIGALLPDLDSTSTLPGRFLPFISRRLESWLGRLQEWHSVTAAVVIAILTSPLLLVLTVQAWLLVPLGFVSHLIIDLLHPEGILLLWPLSNRRYSLLGGPLKGPNSNAERRLAAILALVALILLLVVEIGSPEPQPVAAPSYEETLEQYYSLRGRNLVTAAIEGSWQSTGRRASGRFEVINAVDHSFVLFDHFTGKVFTAGRTAADNFYPSRISLQTGPAARIKPVEIHLEGQRLAEALPVIYQMQREPGLQHIFVSGDVMVPSLQEVVSPTLAVDYSQSSIRRIQAHDAGHYSFHYLTAGELIALANVQVNTADLIIWATYIEAGAEPTVTPLPTPVATPAGEP